MKIPQKIKAYCPHCRKHTEHKVSEAKTGKRRSTTAGQIRHVRKTKGYTSKVAGKAKHVKQSKKQKMMLTCSVCKKKHEKIIPRTRKKTEVQKS